MTRSDLLFILALCLWAILIACVIAACGGSQRRCQQADALNQKGGEQRCMEGQR